MGFKGRRYLFIYLFLFDVCGWGGCFYFVAVKMYGYFSDWIMGV